MKVPEQTNIVLDNNAIQINSMDLFENLSYDTAMIEFTNFINHEKYDLKSKLFTIVLHQKFCLDSNFKGLFANIINYALTILC